MSLLWLLCHYYITFLCRLNARSKKLLNLLWICEFRFKCSMTLSSLAVVFFLRPFLWGILTFRFVETVCKPFTLFHSKWETKLRYQGQLNHPTPRMTKNYYVVFYPMCLGRPCIRRSLRLWKERGYAILSFYLRWFVIFQWLLHKNFITQTSLHLNIHSLLRMLQYLWHGRVHVHVCPYICVRDQFCLGGLRSVAGIFYPLVLPEYGISWLFFMSYVLLFFAKIVLRGSLGTDWPWRCDRGNHHK